MSKNYEVLTELVPKTQELHRTIFDKGYEQGRQVIDKIRIQVELEKLGYSPGTGYYRAIMKVLQIIDKYKTERSGE